MSYYRELPSDAEKIRSWSIYDLVDDWVSRSEVNPSHQLVVFFGILLSFIGVMLWWTIWVTSFPSIAVIAYIVSQVGLLVATIVTHELCHAAVIVYYGGVPRFGAKFMEGLGPVVYVTTGGYFTVNAYRNITAAPLLSLSVICFVGVFLGLGWWMLVPFFFNSIGAGGDLLSLRVLRRYPRHYLVEDTRDGFVVYGRRGSRSG